MLNMACLISLSSINSLESLLKCEGILTLCNRWKDQVGNDDETLTDIFDGQV